MPCRILHVNTASCIAGTENSLLQLVQGLDRSQFESYVALPGPGPLADALCRIDVPVLYAPLVRLRRTANPVRLARTGAASTAAALLLAGHARRRRVCLAHAHKTGALPVAGVAAALAGVPCIWHLRDFRVTPPGARLLACLADAAIAVSRAVLQASGITPDWGLPVRVIPNGIDADAFAVAARPGRFRTELGLGADDPLLLVAAQLVPWKGHRDFLRALALARRGHPRVVAALAGADLFRDHPGYLAELRRLAHSLGLQDAVRFLGYRTDMPDLMADADLLVIPSEAEPFGRVALEAMAVGTPVVGRGTGGLPEVVEDGVTGRLTRPAEAAVPAALAELICDLLADRPTRKAMGAAARVRVREQFSLARHVEEVCSVYRQVLHGRG